MINSSYKELSISQYSNLLLSFAGKKTFSKIAESADLKVEKIYKEMHLSIEKIKVIKNRLKQFSRNMLCGKKYLIIDDTFISKQYAKRIDNASWHFDGSTKRTSNGLCYVTSMLTDTTMNIPFESHIYLKRSQDAFSYKTKSDIALDIISSAKTNHDLTRVLADAHYSTKKLIGALISDKINFLMKITRSKCVTINGIRKRLDEHLRLRKNEQSKSTRGFFDGNNCYFHVIKIPQRGTLYFISNDPMDKKTICSLYKIRWKIEPFHRTAKQLLGLKDCASRNQYKQYLHMLSVMESYALADLVRTWNGFNNVETAIRHVRDVKPASPDQWKLLTGESVHVV